MDINEVKTIYEVLRQLKERVERKGCEEGKIKDESCKYIFDDFDDWCDICVLETAVYFLGKSIEVNEQIANEALNASRQANQGTTKISNGDGGSSSES